MTIRRPPSHTLGAFTLVELLVVITIIALLISLLLPAVQSAREAARQAQCQNNMKQLGLACLNYENQYWCFPPSAYCVEGSAPASARTHLRNWVIAILPFLEQQPLYDSFDFTVGIEHSNNRTARGTNLPVMRCPTDPNGKVLFTSTDSTGVEGDNWARGNYAANASLAFYCNWGTGAVGKTGALSISRWHRAVMGSNVSMGVSEIYDGASNTLLLGEIRTGLAREDRRGTWALDHPGASSLWGHAWGDDNGPNSCSDLSDDVLDCTIVKNSVGAGTIRKECMTCCDGGSYQATPRSLHAGGVYVTLADGSVRFMSNYVEKGTGPNSDTSTPNMTTQFLCWQRICASQDGQVIDGKKF